MAASFASAILGGLHEEFAVLRQELAELRQAAPAPAMTAGPAPAALPSSVLETLFIEMMREEREAARAARQLDPMAIARQQLAGLKDIAGMFGWGPPTPGGPAPSPAPADDEDDDEDDEEPSSVLEEGLKDMFSLVRQVVTKRAGLPVEVDLSMVLGMLDEAGPSGLAKLLVQAVQSGSLDGELVKVIVGKDLADFLRLGGKAASTAAEAWDKARDALGYVAEATETASA